MSDFLVRIPITGVIEVEIQDVDTEEEAISAALEDSYEIDFITEFDTHRDIKKETIAFPVATAEVIEDDEDETQSGG